MFDKEPHLEPHRPLALVGTREWSARRAATEDAQRADTPQELAGRVEAALERADRLLFTVTPRAELEMAAQWQRVADQAWCGQLRHVVASTSRMSSADRDFAGDELALALGVSPGAGRALVWECGAIAALPGLVEAVESGRLTQRHVRAAMRVLDDVVLTLEQRQAIVLIALARYVDQTPTAWADLVRRLILTVDPEAARRRRDGQVDKRRVEFYPRPDEQGAMWLQAPVEVVAAAEARVSAEARRLKASGDPRTMEQLCCDVALALLTHGRLDGQLSAPFEVQVITPLSVLEGDGSETADLPGWGPVSAATARELAAQAGGFTQVAVDVEGRVVAVGDRVAAAGLRGTAGDGGSRSEGGPVDRDGPGHDSAPGAEDADGRGEAPGASPQARVAPQAPVGSDDFLIRAVRVMRRPPVRRVLSGRGYRPSTRLTRFVRARDRTCVFPGCRRPAARTDLDHRVPWPYGRTVADNLQCLCRHHHRAKHAIFTVLLDPDGTVVWITRGGWVFRRRPSGD